MNYIHKLIDLILLNAYAVHSAGLYNGKSGLSLCLFEISNNLNDERIEKYAVDLLQTSLVLVAKSKNINFEDGQAGVGFVLLYLIKNKLIDADFEDLFGKQLNDIYFVTKNINPFSIDLLHLVYFFEILFCSKNHVEHGNFIVQIFGNIEKFLEKQFRVFAVSDIVRQEQNITNLLNIFESYLKAVFLCKNYVIPMSLIDQYILLYQKDKILNRFTIGYYLEKIAFNLSDDKLNTIAHTNKKLAIQHIYPCLLTLSQQIDYLYLLNEEKEVYEEQIHLLENDLFNFDSPEYEKNILRKIPHSNLIVGYKEGIARLLLYWVYRENKSNNKDYSRFLNLP
jgi:hypothetical protein